MTQLFQTDPAGETAEPAERLGATLGEFVHVRSCQPMRVKVICASCAASA
jgi:hypothetical protein